MMILYLVSGLFHNQYIWSLDRWRGAS
jgi:hypothetical protein